MVAASANADPVGVRFQVHFGSSLALRSFARVGSGLSVLDFVNLGSSLALRSCARMGSALSVLDFLALGSSVSLRSFARLSSAASVLDFVNLGSSMSLRSFARIGSQLSVLPAPASNSTCTESRAGEIVAISGKTVLQAPNAAQSSFQLLLWCPIGG